MKFVSDEEYEQVLQEKILKVDVEIALINERIEQLKKPGPISVESIREDEDGQE